MNNIKNYLFFITAFIISTSVSAQQVKPKFKQLKLVIYTIEGLGTGQYAVVTDMLEIDKNGLGHKLSNYYLDGYIKDTTFQIPDTLMAKLNRFFNGETPLESHRITDRMPGEFYGPNIFITYQAPDNSIDNFIFINGFVDQEFENVVSNLRTTPWPQTKQIGKIYHNKQLEALILKYHLTCKYIPQKTHEPPRVRQLEIADPGVKH